MPGVLPLYLREIIERLNSLFGEAAPILDPAAFVNQIAAIAREDRVCMAQVGKADKDLALKGNLPGAVQKAVLRAMTSNNALATLLLKSDRQSLGVLTNVIYDLLRAGENLDVDMMG